MTKLLSVAKQFRDDEGGTAMVEYSILTGIIAGAAILAIIAVGLWVTGRFSGLCTKLDGAFGGTCVAATGAGN
jgi:pilus assembly protein Flp/PilA